MVKLTAVTVFSLCLVACRGSKGFEDLSFRVLELPVHRPGGSVSLFEVENGLVAVYADDEAASLAITDIPLESHDIPEKPPIETFSDKIAAEPALLPDFGAHAGSVIGGTLHLFYLDRKKENAPFLKWLTRAGSGPWNADVLETDSTAWPVAIVGDGGGNAVLFWIVGLSLMAHFTAGEGETREVLSPIFPGARASVSGNCFSYYDPTSRLLRLFTVRGGSVDWVEIVGGNPVQCVSRTPTGLPAVVSFSPEEKRIFLFEQTTASGAMRRTTVALSEDTHCIFSAPCLDGYVFLYDGIGKTTKANVGYLLYLLVPKGRRYERYAIMEADTPISVFSAVLDGSILYVLVQDRLAVLEVRLPS
jgi:hypothetical protein